MRNSDSCKLLCTRKIEAGYTHGVKRTVIANGYFLGTIMPVHIPAKITIEVVKSFRFEFLGYHPYILDLSPGDWIFERWAENDSFYRRVFTMIEQTREAIREISHQFLSLTVNTLRFHSDERFILHTTTRIFEHVAILNRVSGSQIIRNPRSSWSDLISIRLFFCGTSETQELYWLRKQSKVFSQWD